MDRPGCRRRRGPRVGERAVRHARVHLHADGRPRRDRGRAARRRSARRRVRSGRSAGWRIEPSTRRRMRLNGRGVSGRDGITIALEQVYSNCPKYIATREVEAVARRGCAGPRGEHGARRARHRAAGGRRHRVRRHARAGWARRLPPWRAPRLPPRDGRAHDRLARLSGQPHVQHAGQHRERRRAVASPSSIPEDGTTLYVSGRASILWDEARAVRMQRGRRGAARPRRTPAMAIRASGAEPAARGISGPPGSVAGCRRGPGTARRSPTGTRSRPRRTRRRETSAPRTTCGCRRSRS